MRRALFVLAALAFLVPPTAAGARPRLSCANPTRMNMTDGHYTTAGTKQYNGHDFVNMDAWSPDPTLQQSMSVCSTGRWDATVRETDKSNPRVVTYPDSEYRWTTYEDCGHSPDWSTLGHLSSSWALTPSARGDFDVSFDIFVGGTIAGHDCGPFQEIMLYTQVGGDVFAPAPLAHFATKDGQRYVVWWNADHSYVQARLANYANAGRVHWKQVLRALADLGVAYPHGHLNFLQFGVEVVSGTHTATAGPMTFRLSDFKVTT